MTPRSWLPSRLHRRGGSASGAGRRGPLVKGAQGRGCRGHCSSRPRCRRCATSHGTRQGYQSSLSPNHSPRLTLRERARTLHLASSSIDELDEIGIDYAHFVLAGEEGREPYVADRSLARHEVRAELVLAHPPSQRKALMCDVPQSCREVATRGIKPFGLRHLASTGGWVHVEAASGHERTREVHDLRLREVALQGGDGLLLSSHQRVHAGEVVEAASQVDVQP